jgi:hypothetical protein
MANLAMIMWRAWSVQNKVTRAGEALSIDDSVAYLARLGPELQGINASTGLCHKGSTRERPGRPTQGSPGSLWAPPTYATVKINVDGAYNPVTGEAAVGMIARDHGDNPQVMAWRLISNSRDAEEAKALVCLEGVKLLHHWPEPCPGGAGDRLHNGRSNHRDCSVISAIIGDIKEIMQSRRTCRIQKVWREQNRIATICYEVW